MSPVVPAFVCLLLRCHWHRLLVWRSVRRIGCLSVRRAGQSDQQIGPAPFAGKLGRFLARKPVPFAFLAFFTPRSWLVVRNQVGDSAAKDARPAARPLRPARQVNVGSGSGVLGADRWIAAGGNRAPPGVPTTGTRSDFPGDRRLVGHVALFAKSGGASRLSSRSPVSSAIG
jgi:hypothetical protein